MRTPRTAILSLGLALALGGCSLTQTDKPKRVPTGNLKGISDAISNFSSDAKSGDSSTICTSVLSTALKDQLNRNGSCTTIVNNQLATVSDYTLTIEKYGVSGDTAKAVVQATDNGKLRLYTVDLVKQAKGGWRLSSLG
jgi:exo-beta-1,3-glucanase (GH17 family)